MDSQIFSYLLPTIISIITIGAPVIKLNSTITNLDNTLKNVIKRQDEDRSKLEKSCDKLEVHEIRLTKLEK